MLINECEFLNNIVNYNFSNICIDSRAVKPGDLFISINSVTQQNTHHVVHAIKQGAQIIVVNDTFIKNDFSHKNIILIKSADTRIFASKIAQILYQPNIEKIIAVTGTNGKSSVVSFINQILNLLNKKSISIGTMGANINNVNKKITTNSTLTTPDIISINKILKEAQKHGVEYAAIEASSHGIKQKRIANIPIEIASFTNLSHDHMDYHDNMKSYWQTKKELFTKFLLPEGIAIINNDSNYAKDLKNTCIKRKIRIITYGKNADISLNSYNKINNWQSEVSLNIYNKIYNFQTSIIGTFQIYNLMCAIASLLPWRFDVKSISKILPHIENLLGRMSLIKSSKGSIIIDYAHNPDGILHALQSAQQYLNTEGKIITIVGCGGDRDKEKRPIVGKITSKYSDIIIITDDNTRTEDPKKIRTEIIAGINKKKEIFEISNRQQAIKYGISLLKEKDILMILGKGHEKYGTTKNLSNKNDMSIVKKLLLIN